MFEISDFQKLVDNFNYRPLMLNKEAIDKFINIPNFYGLEFYVVSSKIRGVNISPITTVVALPLNYDYKPIDFNGKISNKIDTKKLKEAGFQKDKNLENTRFLILKGYLKIIIEKLSVSNASYCVFAIEHSDFGEYNLRFEIIEKWREGGGGGPGQGVAKTPYIAI